MLDEAGVNFLRYILESNLSKEDLRALDSLVFMVLKLKSTGVTGSTILKVPYGNIFHRGPLEPEAFLKTAICLGETAVTKILFEHGAKLEKISLQDFGTAAEEFLKRKNSRESMVLLLLEHGLEDAVECCWRGGINLLTTFLDCVDKKDRDAVAVAEIILNSRLTSTIRSAFDGQASEALIAAIKTGNVELVKFLIDRGASIQQVRDSSLISPLFLAVVRQDVDIVDLLVRRGADVQSTTQDGYTVLHEACKLNLGYFIEYLLDEGADPCAQTSGGLTPLNLLTENHLGRCGESLVTILKKLAILKFQNLPIPKGDVEWIESHPKILESYEEMRTELEEMANTAFWGSRTLYSLLKMTSSKTKKLSHLAKNLDHLKSVRDNIYRRYSFFQADLIIKLEEAVDIWNETLVVKATLSEIFQNSFPDLVLQVVAENLAIKDFSDGE